MLKVAFRNLIRQKQRYIVIFSVIVLGFAVVVLFIGTVSGMNRTLQSKAARYFAGDISIAGYKMGSPPLIEDQIAVDKALRDSGVPFAALCRRTNYEQIDASVFFNGDQVRQRRLVGIDWAVEWPTFANLDYASGGLEGMGKGNGILVSSSVADKTGLRVGDECMLLLSTRSGAKNTLNLIVSGVYRESSFFGATAYLDIDTLNTAWGLPLGAATDMGMMLKAGIPQDWAADKIRESLGRRLSVGPVIHDRQAQVLAMANAPNMRSYSVMTLDAHLSTINEITGAISIISWFLLVLFMLIIMIGINNTYRMIIRERMREIGTMRAMGMQKRRLIRLFLSESCILTFSGSIGGSVIGIIGLQLIAGFDFSSLALAAMFLQGGHLVWFLSPELTLGAFIVMIIAALTGALGPSRTAAAMEPVAALNQGMT